MDYSRNWNILCWNVRGLNDPDKWDLIRNKLEESACSLFCFQETKKEEIDAVFMRKFALDVLIVLSTARQKVLPVES